jgi:hypothetical protein
VTAAFVSGAIAMAYAVAALFFLRFRRDTGDRLFGRFAAAFGLLTIGRALHPLMLREPALEPWSFALRALAFLVIGWAVIDKNRSG